MALLVKPDYRFNNETVTVNIEQYCLVVTYANDIAEGVLHSEADLSFFFGDNRPVGKAVSLLKRKNGLYSGFIVLTLKLGTKQLLGLTVIVCNIVYDTYLLVVGIYSQGLSKGNVRCRKTLS